MAQDAINNGESLGTIRAKLNADIAELFSLIPNLQPYATTAQVTAAISTAVSGVVGAAPTNLNDLGKVATAIQALQTLLNNAVDNDNFVNSFQDVLQLLQNFSEGTDLASVIADKIGQTAFNAAITNLQNSLGNYVTTSALAALQAQVNGLVTVPAIKPKFGVLIPLFKNANRFDNLGAAAAPTFNIASGGGLVSTAAGTVIEKYLKLPQEVMSFSPTRTDWLVQWDTTDTNAITLGLGTNGAGYNITIANVAGSLVVTFPSGATVSGAIGSGNLTGIVALSVSIAVGNGTFTFSVSVLGTPTLATTNPFRVPVWETTKQTKFGLFHAYFNSSSTLSKIYGFLHNSQGWSGDPFGQLLTQTVVANGAGFVNFHDNLIVIPARADISKTLRVVNYCHGRTLQAKSIFDITIADNGETARQLLKAGYAIIGTSGGVWSAGQNTGNECDYWGNPIGTARAAEVYDALAANVYNVGDEYLIGWSMGGCSTTNYARQFCNRVKAVDLCCPVMDMQETATNGVQTSTPLRSGIEYSYAITYVGKTGAAGVDPKTDDGTNYRMVAGPGQSPPLAIMNVSVGKIAAATTGVIQPSLSAGDFRIESGSRVIFLLSGLQRTVVSMVVDNDVLLTLDSAVTTPANELVCLVPPDNRLKPSNTWQSFRASALWNNNTVAVGAFTKQVSANPIYDCAAYNPANNTDFYAEVAIPIRITTSGGRAAYDGILNNEPMYAFADAVNAITPGLVTMVQGSGGHIAAGTLNATATVAYFNAR